MLPRVGTVITQKAMVRAHASLVLGQAHERSLCRLSIENKEITILASHFPETRETTRAIFERTEAEILVSTLRF